MNRIIIPDSHPLLVVSDLLNRLVSVKFMSIITLCWQIEADDADKEKTAFCTPDGLFVFNRMPFSIISAPAAFQRLMNQMLDGLQHTCGTAYLDDIIVYSNTFEVHIEHLTEVFNCLRAAGLCIKPSKCLFLKTLLEYVGHIILEKGIVHNPCKIAAIQSRKMLASITEVRQFLGITGYYRKFVRNYADIAQSLIVLIAKYAKFTWLPGAETSFQMLKQHLQQALILAYPDVNKQYRLYCDASDQGTGTVLTQVDSEGRE